jgi:hypothetical protein
MMQSKAPVYCKYKDMKEGKEEVIQIMRKFKETGVTDRCLVCTKSSGKSASHVYKKQCVQKACGECLVRVSCLSVMFVQFCANYVASVLFVCHVRTDWDWQFLFVQFGAIYVASVLFVFTDYFCEVVECGSRGRREHGSFRVLIL